MLPFLAGLVVGTAAIGLYRSTKAQGGLEDATDRLKKKSVQAQDALRHAAISGLSTIESSSAHLRDRLQPAPDAPADEAPAAQKAAPKTRKRATPKRATSAKKTEP